MAITRMFTVTGMSCDHCESAVREEVGELAGVAEIDVSSASGLLTVTLDDEATATDGQIIAAVDEAGYQAAPHR